MIEIDLKNHFEGPGGSAASTGLPAEIRTYTVQVRTPGSGTAPVTIVIPSGTPSPDDVKYAGKLVEFRADPGVLEMAEDYVNTVRL